MRNRPLVGWLGATLMLGLVAPSMASQEPYPLDYFALREVVNNVQVSPDGKWLAMLKIPTKDGDPSLVVHDVADLEAEPLIVGADPMEITSYYWASDEHIIMILRQRVGKMVKRQEGSVFRSKFAILDVKDKRFDDFDAAFPNVENVLPGVPGKIIISEQPGMAENLAIREAFRPRAYYELDLERGTKRLLIRGKLDLGQIDFDSDGNPRVARGYDSGAEEYVLYYRGPKEKGWDDVRRISEDDFEIYMLGGLGFVGYDDAKPGNLLMRAFNGDDKIGLWSFNPKTKKFDELIYRRSDVDVAGVRGHSNAWTFPDRTSGVVYYKDKINVEYFDEIEGATYNQLEQLIPHAHYVTITSRSRDGNTLVARNLGPRDPGTYYLLHDGEFEAVGSRQPLLESEKLADTKYMEYKARDGRKLAMYVTIPNSGEAPYPTVVMPHGGPFVPEVVLYDEWSQMLANNGYMVVQPQYRGSHNYGMDHFLTAFIDGSEGGRAMQDDKDDAALRLVELGMADPDRLAMYGWSYGGYAALIAASRTPQIYQCAIAGAAVSDLRVQGNETYRRTPDGIARVIRDNFSYTSVQPVDEAEKVNVPVLVIHGSVDSRVLPKQAKLYRDALDKAGKPYKYVELDGADHFYSTLWYEHQIELYESIIDFLANDCGMQTGMQASAAN